MRTWRVFLAMCIALAASFQPSIAQAEWADGNRLYEACSVKRGENGYSHAQALCLMYVVGVYDGLEFEKSISKIPEYFCIPDGVVAKQLQEVVSKYLENHPENRQRPAANLVVLALIEAFPCKAAQAAKP